MNICLIIGLVIALAATSYLFFKLYRVRQQLSIIQDALQDIKKGNLNRRVLADQSDMTKQICYDLNAIAVNNQSTFIQQKQSEQAYKRLMTSLSHDVKTPLASLVGYLEAVEDKMVMGEEKEEYIHIAMSKANHLKRFVEALFEWVKLDAGEQIFHFEPCDINELSRHIASDWILVFENNNFDYDIDIPEAECIIRVDTNAYTRIINNIFQNVLAHSQGNKLIFKISESTEQVHISVTDNGKGITSEDLPHVFERMYQGDHARSAKGNGLGLSITKELVTIHGGAIKATSIPESETTLTIKLPKAL